jgi:N6-adenosine-specific RNA methylase IME4
MTASLPAGLAREFTGASPVALSLDEALPFKRWVEIGQQLCAMERGVQWWIGDWWAFGGARYGDRAEVAANGIGWAFQTLVNCGVVARRFSETNRRRLVLSFKHHAEVAKLAPAVADALLDQAEREEWSTRDLRLAVNRADQKPPSNNGETCSTNDLDSLIASGQRFGSIYADPPWLYDNQGTRAATGNHYEGMTVDELCALPIGQLAADNAHLHLWTTNAFLFECPRLFKAWGFEWRSSFVWVKSQIGIGNYWRNSHELLLTAVRGSALSFRDHNLRSWLECDRGRHSAKPEQVRHMIEKASPGPFLELFGRTEVEGWTVWGDQVQRSLLTSWNAAPAAE